MMHEVLRKATEDLALLERAKGMDHSDTIRKRYEVGALQKAMKDQEDDEKAEADKKKKEKAKKEEEDKNGNGEKK